MKKTLVLLSLVIVSFALTAQTHIPASKSIVGIWRQTGAMDSSGQLVNVTTGNYKVINPDGTFYTFITWGMNAATQIGEYGTYKITSDSTCIEHIEKHVINSAMSGTDAPVRYRLTDENTLLSQWKSGERWISEKWARLQLSNQH